MSNNAIAPLDDWVWKDCYRGWFRDVGEWLRTIHPLRTKSENGTEISAVKFMERRWSSPTITNGGLPKFSKPTNQHLSHSSGG